MFGDQNKTALHITNTDDTSPSYIEALTTEITPQNVKANLAVLSNAVLKFGDGTPVNFDITFANTIQNDRVEGDNLYFDRGQYDPPINPSTVIYLNNIPVIKTAETHPYGIIEIGPYYFGAGTDMYTAIYNGKTYGLPDTIAVGGEVDLAFR